MFTDWNKSIEDSLLLNNMVANHSMELLNKFGISGDVKLGKSDRRKYKMGNCFYYSGQLMSKLGVKYFEGYFIDNDRWVSHVWNCDNAGSHFDFTLKSIQNFT